MSPNLNAIQFFRDKIEFFANERIGALSCRVNSFSKNIQNKIIFEITKEAVTKAEEMLAPTLVSLRAANFKTHEIEFFFKNNIFFNSLLQQWENYITQKHKSLVSQLRIAEKYLNKEIADFSQLNGDPHNGLKKPLKIKIQHLNKQKELVFKSVSPYSQKITYDISTTITKSLGIKPIAEHLITQTEDFYIRDFLKHELIAGKINPRKYFYSFGVICSIASLLEITDLHFENILASKDGPKLIDVELLLNHASQKNIAWNYINSGLFQPNTSPISQIKTHRHLFPSMKFLDGKIYYSMTQDIDYTQHLIQESDRKLSNPMDYVSDIEKGVRDSDALIKEVASSLAHFLQNSKNKNIRYLARSTAYYKILQLQLWLPSNSMQKNISSIKSKLTKKSSINKKINEITKEKIITAELNDLINGDIPYFWIDGNSGSLMHSTGLIAKNFQTPVCDAFEKHLNLWVLRKKQRGMESIIKKMIHNKF